MGMYVIVFRNYVVASCVSYHDYLILFVNYLVISLIVLLSSKFHEKMEFKVTVLIIILNSDF